MLILLFGERDCLVFFLLLFFLAHVFYGERPVTNFNFTYICIYIYGSAFNVNIAFKLFSAIPNEGTIFATSRMGGNLIYFIYSQ